MPDSTSGPKFSAIEALIRQQRGNLVAFEFTLTLENGRRIDSNVGESPMVFQAGAGEMLPGLEEELLQLEVGECKLIVLPPEKAYGPIRKEAFRTFPLESIPEEARHVGRKVATRAPDGSEQMLDVVEIRGDKAVLDFNHPLAGQTLRFEVRLLANDPCKV
jgi:FKBP-type peptidyl-prolyl cis-trans isomerase 2